MSNCISRRTFIVGNAVGVIGGSIATLRAAAQAPRTQGDFSRVKALVFDTFGTVVDWRTSVTQQVRELATRKGLKIDAVKFADTWRGGYQPAMNRVRTGELPWTKLDDLHRLILNKLLVDFGIAGKLSETEVGALNYAWHRLQPWPDSVSGLTRLKKKFIIAPLSNGNIALMTDLAKFGGLPWDCILGAELVHHYKPDREVYQSAADFLNLKVDEVMMVAAHLGDLGAAKGVGLRTGFVTRPLEYGPDGKPDLQPNASVDVAARDFNDLATKLGA
ncbi:MAG: haloacid dehalogenase type II [Acidobacteria bacterium]|nr:MAG: haloacid dehalogenase type II [Acidobacteriota bacterium]